MRKKKAVVGTLRKHPHLIHEAKDTKKKWQARVEKKHFITETTMKAPDHIHPPSVS